jgi:hypothetical protein
MRVACSFLLSALLVCPSFGQSSPQPIQENKDQQMSETPPLKQPLAFGLEDGTPVKLRLTRNLSSADATTGERVDFEVLEEIRVKGLLLIPRGGIAWATVTEAQPKRRMARGGKLDVNIDDVRLTDGEKAPLRAVKEAKGGGHTGAMTGAMVGTAIVFFPAAPLFLFMHGKDITIPKGTEITAYIDGDIPLDPAKFVSKAAEAVPAAPTPQGGEQSANPAKPANPAGGPVPGNVQINATPDNCEITVDGKYVGNAPAALKLVPGDHAIIIQKSGYTNWQRVLAINAGDNLNITATLEKQP